MEAPNMAAARQSAGAQVRRLQEAARDGEQFENDLIAGGLHVDQATMTVVRHAINQLEVAAAAWDCVTAELGKHDQGEEYAGSGHAARTEFLGGAAGKESERLGAMQIPGAISEELESAGLLAAAWALPGNKWPDGFRDLPDDAMIGVPSKFLENIPHTWYARTPDELRRVIREVLRRHFPDSDPAEYEHDIVHETEHAAAARAIGCTSRFTFTAAPFQDDDPFGVWYTVPGHVFTSRRSLPKLALAAITAAPSWLSDGDLADLLHMGYQDADDVAERIRRFGQRLPMPASAKARNRPRRPR